MLCKNSGLCYNEVFAVKGVLQVMTDTKQQFQVNIDEVFESTSGDITSVKQETNISEQDADVYDPESGNDLFQINNFISIN